MQNEQTTITETIIAPPQQQIENEIIAAEPSQAAADKMITIDPTQISENEAVVTELSQAATDKIITTEPQQPIEHKPIEVEQVSTENSASAANINPLIENEVATPSPSLELLIIETDPIADGSEKIEEIAMTTAQNETTTQQVESQTPAVVQDKPQQVESQVETQQQTQQAASQVATPQEQTQPQLVTPQVQPQLVTPQEQTQQPQLVTPQVQTQQPQLVTPQVQTQQPQLVTPQVQTQQPQLVTPQVQTQQPQLVTPQVQTQQPQLVTPQVQTQQPQLVTPQVQTQQPAIEPMTQVNESLPATSVAETNQQVIVAPQAVVTQPNSDLPQQETTHPVVKEAEHEVNNSTLAHSEIKNIIQSSVDDGNPQTTTQTVVPAPVIIEQSIVPSWIPYILDVVVLITVVFIINTLHKSIKKLSQDIVEITENQKQILAKQETEATSVAKMKLLVNARQQWCESLKTDVGNFIGCANAMWDLQRIITDKESTEHEDDNSQDWASLYNKVLQEAEALYAQINLSINPQDSLSEELASGIDKIMLALEAKKSPAKLNDELIEISRALLAQEAQELKKLTQ